jgi:hypothetical protein
VPFLKDLALRTGRYIDLRENLRFSGSHLTDVIEVADAARAAANTRLPALEIQGPDGQPTTVCRSAILAVLDRLSTLAREARDAHCALICEGEFTLRERGIVTASLVEARLNAAAGGEKHLQGTLSWAKFRAHFADGDVDDPLIGQLYYLVEHEPARGGNFGANAAEWALHRAEVENAVQKLRESVSSA